MKLLSLVLLGACLYAQPAGILSSNRTTSDWSSAGANPAIQNESRSQCGATVTPAACGANCGTYITNAINACPAHTYLALGPGTFTITDYPGIYIKNDNVTLRGSGADQTTLVFSGSSTGTACYSGVAAICVQGPQPQYDYTQNAASWTGGYSQGSTSITLQTITGGQKLKPAVGATLVLTQLSDDGQGDTGDIYICDIVGTCVQGGGNAGTQYYDQSQLVTVTSITGDATCSAGCTVGISPAIRIPNLGNGGWRAARSPIAWWPGNAGGTASPRVGVGIENLTIDASAPCGSCNGGNTSYIAHAIGFYWAKDTWATGNRIIRHITEPVPKVHNLYITAALSKNYTIANNYIFGRTGGDDYAFHPVTSDLGLWQNNICQNCVMGYLSEGDNGSGTGAHGEVFAYNYQDHQFWGLPANDATGWGQGTMENHTPGSSFLLFEGNEGHSWQEEAYFGQAYFDTTFRNRLWGWDVGQNSGDTTPVSIMALNRYGSAIGNVLGTPGYHNTYQALGPVNYTNCQTSVFFVGGGGNCWGGGSGGNPPQDPLTVSSFMRWGNWDVVNNATQWNASEVPTGLSVYANALPSTQTLPGSFYLPSKPSWWGTMPWPAIGPDVTGGDLPNSGGHAYRNPAHVCADTTPTDTTFGTASSATGGSWSSGTPSTATVTGVSTTGLVPLHDEVTITGASNPAYNCNLCLITATTSNSITYVLPTNPGAWSGTATTRAPARLLFNASACYGSGSTGGSPPLLPPPSVNITSN